MTSYTARAEAHSRGGSRQVSAALRGAVGAVALIAVFAFVTSVPAAADTTMYRGGSGLTGFYPEKITTPLSLDWRFTTNYAGNNTSSPVVVGGTIYFAAGNIIYAINAKTGAQKWRYPEDQPLSTFIEASPAFDNGLVFFPALDGKLYALHADTGKTAWTFDTRSTISSSPTIVDGVLYFGSGDGRVWAIDGKTGDPESLWKGGVKTSDEISGAPAVSNGYVYALSLDQVIHGIGCATAKERWQVRLPGSVLGRHPVAVGDYVYIADGANLHCLVGRTGMQKWVANLPTDIASTPAITEDGIYVVTVDNVVHCYEQRSGRSKWKVEPKLDYDVTAPPTISGNTMIVAGADGGIYALDATSGAVKWAYEIQPSSNNTDAIAPHTSIYAAPVVANGSVLLVTDDGLASFRSDAVDTSPPVISDIEPDMGIVVNGAPPIHFEAMLVDEGTGVDPSTIKLTIDGAGIPKRPEGADNDAKPGYRFDARDSILEYDTPVPSGASTLIPLRDGKHTVSISVADWRGNVATKAWSFTIDNSIQRRAVSKREARRAQNRGQGGMRGGPRGGSGGSGGGPRGGGGGGGGA